MGRLSGARSRFLDAARGVMDPKIGVPPNPKMDGENNGKPDFLMDDLGVPLFLETPIWFTLH